MPRLRATAHADVAGMQVFENPALGPDHEVVPARASRQHVVGVTPEQIEQAGVAR